MSIMGGFFFSKILLSQKVYLEPFQYSYGRTFQEMYTKGSGMTIQIIFSQNLFSG